MGKKIIDILKKIEAILRAGDIYWYTLADDYQSKFSFSSDYNKKDKIRYYRRGDSCRNGADQIAQLIKIEPLPDDFIQRVVVIVANSDVTVIDQKALDLLIKALCPAESL